ncbi:DNA circularization N-terminal domain-containing protein [Pectobacterium odoriferum]|uniref:DNA circularization protein n=1 Tax=Pectobacterium odoriferum TaxID=78398 RepID=UPI0005037E5C|nr:DNA circularization N-terminal domain-containing protein [Pectobacterium odoriferum]KGA31954.1 multidrug DMT transporter permease [Pectobacterium odoriferum]PLY36007.1 multidrug DMT transporter permease [Pectobacterium carotovorum]
MAWADSLQDASFRGVKFDVINARDSAQRDMAQHEYPNLDGADIQDLGLKPHNSQIQAVVWGDDYETRLQSLLEALRKPGAAELIHPVFGAMPNMLAAVFQVNHDADNVNYCTIDIQFVQSKTGNPFFVKDYPLSKADEIFNQTQSLIDSAGTLLDDVTQPLRTAKTMMNKVRGLATGALNMVTIFRSDISGFISSTTDFINFPGAFFGDLRSALSLKTGASKSSLHSAYVGGGTSTAVASVSGTEQQAIATSNYAASPTVIMADWTSTQAALLSVQSMPAGLVSGSIDAPVDMPAQLVDSDIVELIAIVAVAVAIEAAEEAGAVLSDPALTAVLTPLDIEKITNETRTMIQDAIDINRDAYAPAMNEISSSAQPTGLSYQPVIDQLATIALTVQALAEAVINEKPQLMTRTVTAPGNLHLVAHRWYSDYSRASELQRLNPQLRDANNINVGDVLNAYAE